MTVDLSLAGFPALPTMAVHAQPAASDYQANARVKDSSRSSSWIQSLLLRIRLDDDVRSHIYRGNGTDDDPFVVEYLSNDRQDAMGFSQGRRWSIAILQTLATFAVTFASSAYASGIRGVVQHFEVSKEVATLGLSLYVLGFGLGPLVWAPLSELYGRKCIFVISYTAYTAFSVAAACALNITALLVLRFCASACGSSTMTNSGAIIADMFSKEERGLATGLFVTAPFLGPAFGPIAGGFLGEARGWRWILGLIAILSGVFWVVTMLMTRETYAPFMLRRRAKALSRATGSVYVSRLDAGQPPRTLSQQLTIAFTRPWVLLFRGPIVLLTSLYISIIYGTLYMFFAGFPMIFQVTRGWSPGIGGLPFIGVAIGVCLATLAAGVDNKRYVRLCAAAEAEDRPEPEARLGTAMLGAVILPVGLFLFAWTTSPSVHWLAPVLGGMLFSSGLVLVFTSLLSYLVDSYVIYAASVMAANSLLRALFGSAFPLFTTQMYENLGDQWASSIPAFLSLGCLLFPFLFYKYGPQIRSRCKYASEAAKMLEMVRHRHGDVVVVKGEEPTGPGKEAVNVV